MNELSVRLTIYGPNDAGASAVQFGPDPEHEWVPDWRWIVRRFLIYSFVNRQAGIMQAKQSGIADIPAFFRFMFSLRLPLVRELGCSPVVDHEGFYLGFMPSCSAALLKGVSNNSEFDFGSVFLTSVDIRDQERVRAFFASEPWPESAYLRFGEIETREELVGTIADGRGIFWLNPSRPLNVVINNLGRIVNTEGWKLEVAE